MGKVYGGLDVGSTTCHLAVIDEEGVQITNVSLKTSQANLITAIEAVPGELHLHLEASELTGWVRSVLKPRVARVVVSHPKSNAWIAKDPRKNDRVDAYKLAQLVRMGNVHEVYYPEEDCRAEFKQIVQHYDELTAQQARLKIKIKARLRLHGLILRGRQMFTQAGRMAALEQLRSPTARMMVEQLYSLLDQTVETQRAALALMAREGRRYPEIALFRKVPGVGLIGACRFSAYVQTPARFSSKRKLWRYCGLAVIDRRSDGKSLGRRCLDRSSNGRLKDVSYKGFLGAMHSKGDNAFKQCYQQALAHSHNATRARLTTQRKIVAVLRAIWIGGVPYHDDSH